MMVSFYNCQTCFTSFHSVLTVFTVEIQECNLNTRGGPLLRQERNRQSVVNLILEGWLAVAQVSG